MPVRWVVSFRMVRLTRLVSIGSSPLSKYAKIFAWDIQTWCTVSLNWADFNSLLIIHKHCIRQMRYSSLLQPLPSFYNYRDNWTNFLFLDMTIKDIPITWFPVKTFTNDRQHAAVFTTHIGKVTNTIIMIQTGNTQHKPPASLPSGPNPDSSNSFGTRVICYLYKCQSICVWDCQYCFLMQV